MERQVQLYGDYITINHRIPVTFTPCGAVDVMGKTCSCHSGTWFCIHVENRFNIYNVIILLYLHAAYCVTAIAALLNKK